MGRAGFSSFYKKYLTVLIAILLIGLASAWFALSAFQKRYETEKSEQDWLKSQHSFETYISSMDIEDWTDLWYYTYPESMETRENVSAFIDTLISGNIQYARSKLYSDEKPIYVVEDNERSIAEFIMSKDESGEWSVTDSSFRIRGNVSKEIVAPSNCEVICNGTRIGDSFVSSEKGMFFLSEYEDSLINPVNLVTWNVSDLVSEPIIEVIPPEGTEIVENESGQPLLIQGEPDEEIWLKADSFFDMFNKMGLYGYMYLSENIRNAAAMCREDSQAYNFIINSADSLKLAPCHSLYETEKKMDDIIIWADNAVSVDISYNTETTYAGNEKDYFSGEYRILFIDFGEGYEICGIVNQ